MENAKQWATALAIVAVLAGALVYQAKNSKVTLAEAKSDIDLSTLRPGNSDCSISSPDGKALDISSIKVIPKGTFITSECFGSRKP